MLYTEYRSIKNIEFIHQFWISSYYNLLMIKLLYSLFGGISTI